MLSFLFSKAGAAMIGIVAAALLATWAINAAYQAGRTAERTAILNRSVEILRERSRTDEAIHDMSPRDLCLELGGLPDDCAGVGM